MSKSSLKLLLLLATTASMLVLPASVSNSLPKAHAVTPVISPWTPAGPSSNNLEIKVYGGAAPECADLFAAVPLIDALDVPACVPNPCAGPNYFLTASGYCYTSYWQGVADAGAGAPGTFNFFTALNAFNSGVCIPVGCTLPPLAQSPPLASSNAGSFRQGFSAPTTGLNPYTAAVTPQNSYILNNVYDNLYRLNPVGPELLGWMTPMVIPPMTLPGIPNAALGYIPPPGTTVTIRNTLRIDMFWQDGTKLDARDAAFTYLSLIAAGAPQNPPSMGLITGITLTNCGPLQCNQFDINLSAMGAATMKEVGSVTMLPGHIWSSCASSWNTFNPIAPTIFPLGPGPACAGGTFFTAAPALVAADPIAAAIMIGSGPWTCQNTGSNAAVLVGKIGTGCSSSNTDTPPVGGGFFLTRFGCSLAGATSCPAPFGSLIEYFRSVGNFAGWIAIGDHDIVTYGVIQSCFGVAVGTPPCQHWQEGLSNPGGPKNTGLSQISVSGRFFNLNWNFPYDWTVSPPTGIVAPNPVLYERTSTVLIPPYTLNPKTIAGCALAANGLPPALAYPGGGGYDC